MYAPAFLSLNKKQTKSHNILRAKRLGSIDWRFLGLQNRLYPEALRIIMVPNIKIPLLLVQDAFKINHRNVERTGCPFRDVRASVFYFEQKQAKSHDILKAKHLGSINWQFLGLQNTLYPEALRLSMVPNIQYGT